MKSKHFWIGFLAVLLSTVFFLGACGTAASPSPSAPATTESESAEPEVSESESTEPEVSESETTESEEVVDSGEERVIRIAQTRVPETLNGQRTLYEYDVLRLQSAGLYHRVIDPDTGTHHWLPDLADGMPVPTDDTGKTWTIKLLEGFTFDDGTPIDMWTFDYTYKQAMNPNLANRNALFRNLENGVEYFSGEIDDWTQVGWKVLDNYTAQISYADGKEAIDISVVLKLLSRMDSAVVHPEMFESCFSEDGMSNDYGTTLDKFVASGIYRPVQWTAGQYFEMEKRGGKEVSPIVDVFTADRVQYQLVEDPNTRRQLYEAGEVDFLDTATMREYDDVPDQFLGYNNSSYGIFLNPFSENYPILQDPNFRYALYWAVDREYIAKDIYGINDILPRQYPSITTVKNVDDTTVLENYFEYVPGAMDVNLDGRPLTETGYDPAIALEYFNLAYEANGGQPINMRFHFSDNSEQGTLWAEFLQNSLPQIFGEDRFSIELQATPWETVYEYLRRDTMNFDVMCAGGVGTTWDGEPYENTNWVYKHPEFDRTYESQYCVLTPDAATAWTELFYRCYMGDLKYDTAGRQQAAVEMEQILMDDMTFIPIWGGANRYAVASHLNPITEGAHPELGVHLVQAVWIEE